MTEQETKKENPFLARQREAAEAAKKQAAINKELRDSSLNKVFVNESGQEATVVGFEPIHNVLGQTGPAYCVNFGRGLMPWILCDDFNQSYKLKG